MNRNLVLSGEIEDGTVSGIIKSIRDINADDDEQDKRVRNPIELVINSPGGSVLSGFALIGAIESSTTPIHTVAMGFCASTALTVSLAGHKRYAHRFATFMYHDISTWSGGKLTERKREMEQVDKWVKMVDDYIVSRTTIPRSRLDVTKSSLLDWYFDVNDALKFGVVDELL